MDQQVNTLLSDLHASFTANERSEIRDFDDSYQMNRSSTKQERIEEEKKDYSNRD